MEILLPALRLVHIVGGVFWAGTAFFAAWLLEPSARAAGEAGQAVMVRLIERGFTTLLPITSVLTIVSGGWLYWHVSGHLSSAWGHSPMGTSLTVGAAAALVAFVVGGVWVDPPARRLRRIADQLEGASEAERVSLRDERDAAWATMRTGLRWMAGLLVIAVVGMAIARYL